MDGFNARQLNDDCLKLKSRHVKGRRNLHELYQRVIVSYWFTLRMHERPFDAVVRHRLRDSNVAC